MQIIESTPDHTVGLCCDVTIPESNHIGVYSPKYLLEWAQKLVEMYGEEKVQVMWHQSDAVKAKALVASDDGDNPYVIVTSWMED